MFTVLEKCFFKCSISEPLNQMTHIEAATFRILSERNEDGEGIDYVD